MTTPQFSIDLSGDVAFVTGATSGLGARFAKVLAACGAKVAATGRRVERLEALAEEIRGEGGICEPVRVDMTDRDSIRAAFKTAEEKLGLCTILVNNAGIPDAQYIARMEDDLVDQVFNTNLIGPWVLATEFAKRLIAEKQPGRIVNISSMAAFRVGPGGGSGLYATTKAAIARMTDAMAVEWSRFNINVNAIAPGMFRSEMLDGMLERMGDRTDQTPRKRIPTPDQMDSTLLYLVSPSSECVTGTTIKIDDGQGAR